MADISNIKFNNVGYDIMDAAARAGFAYASVVTTHNDGDWQTRLVFYKDSAKTQELGSFDISGMNLEGLFAKQVMAGEGILAPVISIDNPEDGIADSTYITVKKVNGKPVFVFGSTADGSLGTAKTEVTLPVGASGEVALKSQVDAVASDLAALVGTGNVTAAIDSFNEIVTFLNGIDKTDPTLANQLLGINDRIDAIEAVSGTVDDALSSTSINPVQNKVIKGALDDKANKSELTVTAVTGDTTKKTIQLKSGTSQTVVVEHQDISGKANKSEMSVSKGTGTNAGKTTITLTSETGKSATVLDSTHPAASITDANKTAWNNKQSAINDLDTIRSGAGKGATSVQTISVNGGTAQQPTNGVINLTVATGGDNDLVGLSDGTANDGAVVFTKRNGDTITLDLNHVHPQYVKSDDLAAVATSGSYNDLTDKPTIPAAQVNADWNATSGVSRILNKPTIPTVPTKVSSFTNDAGYLTQHQSLANYYTKSEIDTKIGNIETLLASI